MKIYSFATFFNEHEIFDIKYNTEKNFVDEIYICEANRTFKNFPKPYNFQYTDDCGKIRYHQLDASKKFVSMNVWGKLRLAYKRFSPSFYQRIISNPCGTMKLFNVRVWDTETDDRCRFKTMTF